MSSVRSSYSQRMALLTLLEHEGWACCGRCQRLHPRKEFPGIQRKHHTPLERACMPWVGIVDLCPCIFLTIRDGMRVAEYLGAPEANKPRLDLITKGILSRPSGEQHLSHKCTVYPHMQIDMELSLTKTERVTTSTRYQAPKFDIPQENMDNRMPLCCSGTWLSAVTYQVVSFWDCCRCHAQIIDMPRRRGAKVRVVHVNRSLGLEKWFGDRFETQ